MADLLQYLALNSPFFYALTFWALAWKGLALWYAGRNRQKYWFIAILVLNTLGILPIIYLFLFCKTPFLKEIKRRRRKKKR